MATIALLLLPLVAGLSFSPAHSFRGTGTGRVPDGFDFSGHTSVLPGVMDYLRLVPPVPLGVGGMFASKPLTSEEWVVELAFRVHGREEETKGGGHQGGRGLAFWYTKNANPTEVTFSSDPQRQTFPAPPIIPAVQDPIDPKVSLFGNAVTFDGLGIVFDTSPGTPLHMRSDAQDWGGKMHTGAAVVSGILDDGTGFWIDTKVEAEIGTTGVPEAAYLSASAGACEAAFRNADGVLFARISHANSSIKVELDLSPHTSLAKSGRDYAHTCFVIENVKLPTGSYVGVTGLASGNADPDIVDIYSMEVFEGKKGGAQEMVGGPEGVRTTPLEGTEGRSNQRLTHEIFLAQARMVEAIDDLSRRVDKLAHQSVPVHSTADLMGRLARIDARVHAAPDEPERIAGARTDADLLTNLLQLSERLMVEIKGLNRKIDSVGASTSASLSGLSTRNNEALVLLRALADRPQSSGSWMWYLLVVGIVGGGIYYQGRDGGFGRGKKMI